MEVVSVLEASWAIRCTAGESTVLNTAEWGQTFDAIPGTGDSSGCSAGSCM